MPGTKVIKPKPVDTTRKTQERPKAAKESQSGLRVPAVRKSRASSCPRNPQPERCQRPAGGAQGSPSKPGSERRTRSTSTAPKPPQNCSKANRDCRRANHAAVEPKYQREQRAVRAEAKYTTSHRWDTSEGPRGHPGDHVNPAVTYLTNSSEGRMDMRNTFIIVVTVIPITASKLNTTNTDGSSSIKLNRLQWRQIKHNLKYPTDCSKKMFLCTK